VKVPPIGSGCMRVAVLVIVRAERLGGEKG
jgi:hypothetical protein